MAKELATELNVVTEGIGEFFADRSTDAAECHIQARKADGTAITLAFWGRMALTARKYVLRQTRLFNIQGEYRKNGEFAVWKFEFLKDPQHVTIH